MRRTAAEQYEVIRLGEGSDLPVRQTLRELQVVGWGWYHLSTGLEDYARYIIAWMLRTSMQAADVMETLDLTRAKTGSTGSGWCIGRGS